VGVADQTVTAYDGDLDDYRQMVLSARGARANSRDRGSNEPQQRPRPGLSAVRPKARAAEAKNFGRRGRDRAHQRYYRQDRYRAGVADLFKRDPKQAAQLSKARASAASALQRARKNG